MHDSRMRLAAKFFLNIRTPPSSYGLLIPLSYLS